MHYFWIRENFRELLNLKKSLKSTFIMPFFFAILKELHRVEGLSLPTSNRRGWQPLRKSNFVLRNKSTESVAWIFFLLRRRSGVCEWDSFYPCNNMLFRWRGKLLRNSGKTGVLNNFLFWQRHYKFGTENLKSLQITSHLCSQSRIHESEFRLFYWVVTQVVFLSQMMSSWLWNLFWFLSLGRKNVLASPQKWSVSGRGHLFGFLLWEKSVFL